MGKFVLLDTRIFAGSADLTSNSNRVELTCEAEEQDATPFGNGGWKESIGGLFSTSITAGGQWEATTNPQSVDPTSWDNLTARRRQPWTVCPTTANVGDVAWFTEALRSSYKLGDQVGQVAPWEASASGSAPLVRGAVAHPPGTARTADGTGTGVNLGAVGDGQRLYAALHVLSVAGTGSPTITVSVESDVDNTFATATTQLTFTAAGLTPPEPRGQFLSTVGPVTDTWWRVAWTITGTSPSFLFLVALGIA